MWWLITAAFLAAVLLLRGKRVCACDHEARGGGGGGGGGARVGAPAERNAKPGRTTVTLTIGAPWPTNPKVTIWCGPQNKEVVATVRRFSAIGSGEKIQHGVPVKNLELEPIPGYIYFIDFECVPLYHVDLQGAIRDVYDRNNPSCEDRDYLFNAGAWTGPTFPLGRPQ